MRESCSWEGNTYAKYIFNPHRSWRDGSGSPTGTRIVDKAYAAKRLLDSIYMEALAPSWRKEQVSAQKMQRKSRKLWSRFSRMMRVRHVRRDRWKCWMSSGLHITARGGQYSSAKVHRSVSVDADGTVNVDDASIPGLRYEVIEGR